MIFWWTNENGERQQGEGLSRDVSEHGAFVFSRTCPPVGSNVALAINLEGISDDIGEVPVEVEGEILRVEQAENNGFAIEY